MKSLHTTKFLILSFFLINLAFVSCFNPIEKKEEIPERDRLSEKLRPDEEFELIRHYPDASPNYEAMSTAKKEARQRMSLRNPKPDGFDENWTIQGPGNIGARINSIAVHPTNEDIILIGYSGGGIWKTQNGGGSWNSVFDDQDALYIGDITFDPSNPNIVWAGTGDKNVPGSSRIGDGIYKSTDGGNTWTNMGLTDQRVIAKVVVDPSNTNTIYAGCMGLPQIRNSDRGLYKSTDGGLTWNNVLYVNDSTGVVDVWLAPGNSQTIYAVSWMRIRNRSESVLNSTDNKIYKSTDDGSSWTALSNGLPNYATAKLGMAVSPTNPSKIYVVEVDVSRNLGGIYKSIDGGASWTTIPHTHPSGIDPSGVYASFGWYFGTIGINPANDDEIYILGVDMYKTDNNGGNWEEATPPWYTYEVHADKHDIVFLNSGHRLLATDGGLYKNTTGNLSDWSKIENNPTTQFYRVAYNPHQPNQYYGGAQDNGTTGGNISNQNNWERIYGGDGFQALFHPDFQSVYFVESQRGNIVYTTDLGANYQSGTLGISPSDRRNWDMQYIMSSHNNEVMYTGTQKLYKNTNGFPPNWYAISPSLTDSFTLYSGTHTITGLSESYFDPDELYVGTGDARVWQTTDGGTTWNRADAGLPGHYISSVKASPNVSGAVFVTNSGYRNANYLPHVHRSDDKGLTWTDISSNLPSLAVNDIYVMPGHQDSILFVATDGGVYGTIDMGDSWDRLGENMPMVIVYDLEYNLANNELIAGTYGRSIMTYSLDSIMVGGVVIGAEQIEAPGEPTLSVYPTVSEQTITVEFTNTQQRDAELVILSAAGQLVREESIPQDNKVVKTISVEDLPAGLYYIKVKMRHQIISGSFIKI